jgi:hypothetical protein
LDGDDVVDVAVDSDEEDEDTSPVDRSLFSHVFVVDAAAAAAAAAALLLLLLFPTSTSTLAAETNVATEGVLSVPTIAVVVIIVRTTTTTRRRSTAAILFLLFFFVLFVVVVVIVIVVVGIDMEGHLGLRADDKVDGDCATLDAFDPNNFDLSVPPRSLPLQPPGICIGIDMGDRKIGKSRCS